MKKYYFIIILSIVMSGCASVAGNYPTPTTSNSVSSLPRSWQWRDEQQPVLWQLEGHSKAFFAQWDDLKIALAKAEYAADKGSTVAASDARELSDLVNKKLTIARVALFYISATAMPLKQGDVTITFENGDVVNDHGILYWDKETARSDHHSSQYGSITISNRLRKAKEPLLLRILVPEKYLGQKIISIAFPVS